MSRENALLLYAVASIIGLVVLVARYKLHPFIALTLASLFIGICAGLKPTEVAQAYQDGVGAVLGSIAIIIGLGTVLGKMLAESGGAERVAHAITGVAGERRLPWAMLLVAFIIGTPVFFAVGLVLLAPIAYTLTRQTRTPLLLIGIPMVAALSVTHGLVPPHPGPIAAVSMLNADIGLSIFYSILVGVPVAIVVGPLFAFVATRFVASKTEGGLIEQLTESPRREYVPSVAATLFTILLPVLLMMGSSLVSFFVTSDHPARQWADFFGHPIVALLAAVLLSFYTFGTRCGFTANQMLAFATDSLTPIATVILVIGAGGGFSKVLRAGGIDAAISGMATEWALPPLLFGWLVASLIRVATGSSTVAISAAAGLLAPIVASNPDVSPELMVIAMGAGSLILSHVNDGGFWLVKEYLNLSVTDTLKTWTVIETIAATMGLALVLLLDMIV